MRTSVVGVGWALTLLVVERCATCASGVSLLGRSRRSPDEVIDPEEEDIEEEEDIDEPAVVIPPECVQRTSLIQTLLLQRSKARDAQLPFAPAPGPAVAAAAPVAAPTVPVAPAVAPLAPGVPAPAPPPAPDCAKVLKKEAKQKKKAAKKAQKKQKKKCKAACKAAKKLRDKAAKEAEDAAKKGGAAIKEQVKIIKESIGKDTKAEVAAIKAAIKEAGKASREELTAAVKEDMVAKNETARNELQGLAEKIVAEDRDMFDEAKEHETNLAEKVQKLVWEEGLQSAYDATMELTANAGEKAHDISEKDVIPAWDQSLHDAEHAKNVSKDSLHSILSMWQAAVTKNHQTWSKVSAAFDSANMASRLSHDTVTHVISGMELTTLLRDTSVFYKLDAKEAYDRSAALLSKAQQDLATTERNAQLIAGLEEATENAAGAAQRAIDAAKKVSTKITEMSK